MIIAVLHRLQLNAHCEFAPKPLYHYYIPLKGHFYVLFNGIDHIEMGLRG